MSNSNQSLTRPSSKTPRYIVWGFLVISVLGFIDAAYLTVKHYLGTPIGCSILEGCEQVTSSPFAVVAGIPVALAGAIYYLFVLIAVLFFIDTKREEILFYLSFITALGFFASLWFLYLQFFVIGAVCIYCLISAGTSTLLFVLGIFTLRFFRDRTDFPNNF